MNVQEMTTEDKVSFRKYEVNKMAYELYVGMTTAELAGADTDAMEAITTETNKRVINVCRKLAETYYDYTLEINEAVPDEK